MRRSFTAISLALITFLSAIGAVRSDETVDRAAERAERRARVRSAIADIHGGRGALVVRSPAAVRYSGDVDYAPFRADSNVLYLTGIDLPRAALLVAVADIEGIGREALFLPPPEAGEGLWIARRITVAEASRESGVPEASIRPLAELPAFLQKTVPVARPHHGVSAPAPLYFDGGPPSPAGEPLSPGYGFLLAHLGSRAFHLELLAPDPLVTRFRQVKSAREVAHLRRAIAITCESLGELFRWVEPGQVEAQAAAQLEGTFRLQGARGWAFPSIVASGPNTCILHYDRYERRFQAGDLLLLDVGAEHEGYAADVSRTIPISGRFTARQRQIHDIVRRAQDAAFLVIRPGARHSDVDRAAREVVAQGLIDLGLIREASDAGRFLPHGVSHGLGLDVHDPLPDATLRAGMVITVEPGIYIPDEALGVRIEDDVLVTETGCEILSGHLPRAADAIERWMRSASL